MKNPVDFSELAKTLKRLLREKGITYRELGERLGLSESNVKKVFIADDCSLARLNQICAILELTLGDLIAAVSERRPEKYSFTLAQENFLMQNRRYFHVYWKLVSEEYSLEKIKKELGLTESVLFKILRGLDGHGLIELLPGGRVKSPNMDMTSWDSKGPLLDMARREWAPLIMRKVGENVGNESARKDYGLALRHFELRPESAEEFKQAIEEVQIEFGRRSVREKRLYPREIKPVFLVTGYAPSCFVEEL